MNIGYEFDGSSGVLNKMPHVYGFETIRELTNFIRRCSVDLVDWAVQNNIPKSSLVLYTSVNRYYTEDGGDWVWNNEFNIHCKNIREYKPFLKMSSEEISAILEATKRERTINDVLDGEES